MKRTTIRDVQQLKERREKFAVLTAYDYTSSRILDAAGIRLVLVGDSLGQVVLGYDSTLPVTLDEMIHHTKAVVRGSERTHVVADMPFMSYQSSPDKAILNAGRMLKETGCQSVKMEGGSYIAETVKHTVASGIPVMGHIGLTPQSVNQIGGYRIQGKTPEEADRFVEDALCLEEAGAYSVVLELMPSPLAKLITERLSIPTIGIGAGPYCDGQVQVLHDILGLYNEFVPSHTKRYAELGDMIESVARTYMEDVEEGRFPASLEVAGKAESVVPEIEISTRGSSV